MKNLKDTITEKLIITKDSKLAGIDINLESDTDFEKDEIDKIKNYALSLEVQPKSISNRYSGLIRPYLLSIHFSDDNASNMIIIFKNSASRDLYYSYNIVTTDNNYVYDVYYIKSLDELFKEINKSLKSRKFFDKLT